MKVWVLIPAYNEDRMLGKILQELRTYPVSVLVVDDGSQDNTSKVAQENGALLVRNRGNFGKGRALKEGIKYLLAREEFDYLITMDADSQHSPGDLGKFLKEAERGEAFVIGNRMENPSRMPKIRLLTNKFMSWLISKIIKQVIPDTQCGFRLIKREVLEKLDIETCRYQTESEVIIKVAQQGISIKSVPVRSIYFRDLKSKINPLIDTLRFIKFILTFKKNARKENL